MYGEQGRMGAWTMESRVRYALVWGGLNVLILFGLMAVFGDISITKLLPIALIGLVINVIAQGLLGYPKARRKVTAPAESQVNGKRSDV